MIIDKETREELESLSNVVAVGEGADGKVIVGVTEKLPLDQLDEVDVVPQSVDGRETDVIEFGDLRALSRKEYHNPVPAGVSCGHPSITAGTWGTPPLKWNGEHVVLTNAHVAAPPGKAEPGDDVYQPGPHDGGTESVGSLRDFSEISKTEANISDSALFSTNHRETKPEILELGGIQRFGEPTFDDTVQKSGRTTGLTDSSLVARNISANIRGYFPNETVKFEGVDAYEPFSAGGDSGSLILTQRNGDNVGVGLLFAGSSQVTLAIPIKSVLEVHGELEPAFPDEPPEGDEPSPSLLQLILRFFRGLFG